MAGSNRHWILFPLDEGLIERLFDDRRVAGEDADDASDSQDPCDTEGDTEVETIPYLIAGVEEDEAQEELFQSVAPDSAASDDAHEVNMRVLSDYLRRRLIDEPEPLAPTLH